MTDKLTAREKVQKREQYRDWINKSVGFGAVSFFVATGAWIVVDEPLVLFVGLGLYWLGCAGMVTLQWRSPVSVRDELEEQIEREASATTLGFVAIVTIAGIPASVVLETTGVYTVPMAIQGALWAYFLLILVFAAAYGLAERQYE